MQKGLTERNGQVQNILELMSFLLISLGWKALLGSWWAVWGSGAGMDFGHSPGDIGFSVIKKPGPKPKISRGSQQAASFK